MDKKIEDVKIVKEDDRGVIYDCDKIGFILRKKGTISADHSHHQEEFLYLMKREVELTVGDKIENVTAPAKIFIPGGVFHKLYAQTDITLIEDKEDFKAG